MNRPTAAIGTQSSERCAMLSRRTASGKHAGSPLPRSMPTRTNAREGMAPERRARRAGFTLIEVLLASMLTAVLVAALWNLLSMYVRLFETGHTKTEQSQLARTLLRQVENDLHATLPVFRPDRRMGGSSTTDGGNTGNSSATAGRRTASLRGTRDSLELVVLEAVAPTPAPDDAERTPTALPRVPELRKVVYRFVEPVESGPVERGSLPGLLRREMPWEASGPGSFAQHGARSTAAVTGDFAVADTVPVELVAPPGELADDTVLHAPEVVGMSLRYFDGKSWMDGWDSLTRQALPVAVEITLQVRAFDDSPRAGHAAAEARKAQSPSPNEDDPQRPVYRLVTCLSSSQPGGALADDSTSSLGKGRRRGGAAPSAIGGSP